MLQHLAVSVITMLVICRNDLILKILSCSLHMSVLKYFENISSFVIVMVQQKKTKVSLFFCMLFLVFFICSLMFQNWDSLIVQLKVDVLLQLCVRIFLYEQNILCRRCMCVCMWSVCLNLCLHDTYKLDVCISKLLMKLVCAFVMAALLFFSWDRSLDFFW